VTNGCTDQETGAIELYFYDELSPADRDRTERHLRGCVACRGVLEDLSTIRGALAGRRDIDAPPGGDWSGFMRRLLVETACEPVGGAASPRWARSAFFATAAVLALAVGGVMMATRSRGPATPGMTVRNVPVSQEAGDRGGFEALSEEHLQRSKLVVLGLAAKDPAQTTSADWTYERGLAATLLSDTRMYRMAAEERGLRPIAEVMRDLELVLLQASFTDARDPASLPQIQRLIRKRDLVGKMDVVAASGL
jgi:hypothetical protein